MKKKPNKPTKLLLKQVSPHALTLAYVVGTGRPIYISDKWSDFCWIMIKESRSFRICQLDCGLALGVYRRSPEAALEEALAQLRGHTTSEVRKIIKEHPLPPYRMWEHLRVNTSFEYVDGKILEYTPNPKTRRKR